MLFFFKHKFTWKCCFIAICFCVSSFCFSQNISPINTTNQKNVIIKNIWIQGNKKTKKHIINRELSFAVNDTFSIELLQKLLGQSKTNLLNTKLFSNVITTAIALPENKEYVDVFIEVEEFFYIIPLPVIELYDRNYKIWRKVFDGDLERLRYGVKFKYNNFTGNRDVLGVNIINGFKKEISFNYSVPFIDKKLHHGIGFSIGNLQKLGISYIDSLNAALPRKLCDTCAIPNFKLFKQKEFFANVNYQYRHSWFDKHQIDVQFRSVQITDTIATANKSYFKNGITNFNFIDITYQYDYNKVDYIAYPLNGYSLIAGIRKRFTSNDLGQMLLYVKAAKSKQLKSKLYASLQLQASTRLQKNVSFYNMRSADLAFANIRGLEQYLLLSKWDIAFISNLKYQLANLNLKSMLALKNMRNIPIQVYCKAFSDFAWFNYPYKQANAMKQQLLNSNGIGIDVVIMNNYAIRFETSYNKFAKISFFVR